MWIYEIGAIGMLRELLALTTTPVDNGYVVTLVGELDEQSAPRLSESFAQLANGPVTVDLSGLTFIDSAGLQTLFRFHQQMEKQGSWVALRDAQAIVLRVIQITGLDQLMHIERAA